MDFGQVYGSGRTCVTLSAVLCSTGLAIVVLLLVFGFQEGVGKSVVFVPLIVIICSVLVIGPAITRCRKRRKERNRETEAGETNQHSESPSRRPNGGGRSPPSPPPNFDSRSESPDLPPPVPSVPPPMDSPPLPSAPLVEPYSPISGLASRPWGLHVNYEDPPPTYEEAMNMDL